ncbi:hypothetical protein L218DRAFT_1081610 [Marasmius fiardii PR-910]|nr:hypothetical protein L218DRAFT_1081610 [Marasmius fiardii PR-910]
MPSEAPTAKLQDTAISTPSEPPIAKLRDTAMSMPSEPPTAKPQDTAMLTLSEPPIPKLQPTTIPFIENFICKVKSVPMSIPTVLAMHSLAKFHDYMKNAHKHIQSIVDEDLWSVYDGSLSTLIPTRPVAD